MGKALLLFALMSVFLTGHVFANVVDADLDKQCIQKISVAEKWSTLTHPQLDCIVSSSGFAKASEVLCTEDRLELSKVYKRFLEYRDAIQSAFEKFRAATNPGDRALANVELQDLRQAQSTYGYSNGIWDALNGINSIKYACGQ